MGLKLTGSGVLAVAGLAAAGLAAWYIAKKGSALADTVSESLSSAGKTLGDGLTWLVKAPDPNIKGPESNAMGLPEPEDVADSPEVARWIIDNFDSFEASKWVTMGALLRAKFMPEWSGLAPGPNTEAGRYLLPRVSNYDETDRLARRYPAQASTSSPDSVLGGYGSLGGYSFADVASGGGYQPWKP